MSNPWPPVTLVTVTRSRVNLLPRAIASVQRQDYAGPLVHLIVVDSCDTTRAYLKSVALPANVRWEYDQRSPEEQSGPARLSKLRNYAVAMAESHWIGFLDDDNEFEPNHVSSLVACAIQSGCPAVHSHMQIFSRDGVPYRKQRMPWIVDEEEATQKYKELCEKGVFDSGSHISRDRADPLSHPDPVRSVDMGEWMCERSTLLAYPFTEVYSLEDWANVTSEDDKLMMSLIDNEVPIACTGMATLKYYLGGYSNDLSNRAPGVWVNE